MKRQIASAAITVLVALVLAGCQEPAWDNPVVTGPHDDEGPADRYAIRYEPVTYGQAIRAPLPGLAYSYKLHDWDGDGLVDVLAKLRRGYGVVVYKNIGTKERPLFPSLHDTTVLTRDREMGRYFDLIDADGDGRREIIAFDGQNSISRNGKSPVKLAVYFREGADEPPEWRKAYVLLPDGSPLESPSDVWNSPRVDAVDWDADGREDLIIGYERMDEMIPPEVESLGANRLAGFRDPSVFRPMVGQVLFVRNITGERGKPVFARPERLAAGGSPISTYVHPNPAAHDINEDGRPDLIVGTAKPGLRVFLNRGNEGLADAGLLQDESGGPILTAIAERVEPADLDGDGRAELIASSYFGNMNRFVLLRQTGEPGISGWQDAGYLSIQAAPHTPVYGMGNSTVDPVDWDGDGDLDLLLGSEPSMPTVVINAGSDEWRKFEPARRLRFVDGAPLETYPIEQGVGSYWGPNEWYNNRVTPRAVDWDGDGTLDVISGSSGRRLHFYKGRKVDGELRFERPVNFRLDGADLTTPDRQMPAVLDWTGDGALDILVNDFDAHPSVYSGDGTVDLGKPVPLRSADGGLLEVRHRWKNVNRNSFTVADWDGDGNRDLIVYRFHLGVYLYRNAGGDLFEEPVALVPMFSHNAGVSVLDWDRDGVLDLLVGGDERRMIEPKIPAHLVVFHGQDTLVPPGP